MGIDLNLDFGPNGLGRARLGPGWHKIGPDSAASAAPRAFITLDLPKPERPDAWRLLELDVAPFLHPPEVPAQRLAVRANGTVLGNDAIETAGPAMLGYVLSPEVLATAPLTLEFRFPNATPPAQFGLGGKRPLAFRLFHIRIVHLPKQTLPTQKRYPPACETGRHADSHLMSPRLADAIAALSHLPPDQFALNFESLGHNCQFGFVQRRWGASPIGLLRCNATTLPALLDGIETAFAAADDPKQVELKIFHTPRAEYFVTHPRYQFLMHTDRFAEDTSEDAVKTEMLRSLSFMKRKFAETLQSSEKIFVYQRPCQTLPVHMRPLLARLQAYGPNRLLFVTAAPQRRAGSLDDLGGGLMHGVVDTLSTEPPIDRFDLAAWTSVCLNAAKTSKEAVLF